MFFEVLLPKWTVWDTSWVICDAIDLSSDFILCAYYQPSKIKLLYYILESF